MDPRGFGGQFNQTNAFSLPPPPRAGGNSGTVDLFAGMATNAPMNPFNLPPPPQATQTRGSNDLFGMGTMAPSQPRMPARQALSEDLFSAGSQSMDSWGTQQPMAPQNSGGFGQPGFDQSGFGSMGQYGYGGGNGSGMNSGMNPGMGYGIGMGATGMNSGTNTMGAMYSGTGGMNPSMNSGMGTTFGMGSGMGSGMASGMSVMSPSGMGQQMQPQKVPSQPMAPLQPTASRTAAQPAAAQARPQPAAAPKVLPTTPAPVAPASKPLPPTPLDTLLGNGMGTPSVASSRSTPMSNTDLLFATPSTPSLQDSGNKLGDLLDFSTPYIPSSASAAGQQQGFGLDELMGSLDTVLSAADNQKKLENLRIATARLGPPTAYFDRNPPVSPPAADVVAALERLDSAPLKAVVSLKTKKAVLEILEKSYNSDARQVAVLVFRESLSASVFYRLIRSLPRCLDSHLNYLMEYQLFDELEEAYRQAGRRRDASMMKFLAVLQNKTPSKIKVAQDCMTYCQQFDETKDIGEWVNEQRELWERQAKIDSHDSQVAATGQEPVFQNFPRMMLAGTPLINLLYYCCFYHGHAERSKLSSPAGIQSYFKMSDNVVAFQLMRCYSRKGEWQKLRDMVEVKGVQGKMISMLKTMSTETKPVFRHPLGVKVFLEIVVLQNGPLELVVDLANGIEDPELRFKSCIQFCHKDKYRKQLWLICADALAILGHRNRFMALKDDILLQVPVEEHGEFVVKFNELLNAMIANPTLKQVTKDMSKSMSGMKKMWGWGQ